MDFIAGDFGDQVFVHLAGYDTITMSCALSKSGTDCPGSVLRHWEWYVPTTDGTERGVIENLLRASYEGGGMLAEDVETAAEKATDGPLRPFWDRAPPGQTSSSYQKVNSSPSPADEKWVHEGRIWPKL